MFLLKSVGILVSLVLLPLLLGELITYKDAFAAVKSVRIKYIMGLFFSLSLFWVLCVPMTFFDVSFFVLTVVYSCILFLLSIAALWIYIKETIYRERLRSCRDMIPKGWEWVYLIIFLFILGLQLYYAAFYTATVWTYDDSEYISYSLGAISSNHLGFDNIKGLGTDYIAKRILNSWLVYIAYLSKISGFHVTTVAHTIIPVIFLMVAYIVYSYIADCVLDKRENKLIFLIVVSFLFIYGFYSQYSLTFRLITTLWQGKAILSAVVIPFLIFFLPKIYKQKMNLRIFIYLFLISMTACSLTMMGAGMVTMVCVAIWLIFALCQRRLSGIWHCLCGCVIPAGQMILYLVMR